MKKYLLSLICVIICIAMLVSCNYESTNDQGLTDGDSNTVEDNVTEGDVTNNSTSNIQIPEAEKAMEIYEAALKNEIKVYETNIKEYNYIKDCKTPYNRIPLCKIEGMGYVYIDVDGDAINELVIDCGDTLILRYYEGCVYVYPFTFRNMYRLNTDGSYSWNYNGQNFEYGENQIAFDGTELKTKELWRIVNDGEPNAEYYIGNTQVTQKELLKYFSYNPKSRVEFLPLEVSWTSNEYPDGKG